MREKPCLVCGEHLILRVGKSQHPYKTNEDVGTPLTYIYLCVRYLMENVEVIGQTKRFQDVSEARGCAVGL